MLRAQRLNNSPAMKAVWARHFLMLCIKNACVERLVGLSRKQREWKVGILHDFQEHKANE